MDTDTAWAAHIRQGRHIGDFQGWKEHDAYQEEFARLLRDLEAVGSTAKSSSPRASQAPVRPMW